ncbi:Cobalamin biosynthetic protein [metagenome]|uniref:Cobalamin biosynthetic protein n=1 Tax=metagenome TaxID=256318 RepID=A0A2P2CCB4_9ZZZZ
MSRSRAAGLLIGYAADRLLGDPARFHPVAGFGRVAGRLEQAWYADARPAGSAYTLVLVGSTIGAGAVVDHHTRDRPIVHALATATVTWAVLGGRSLAREAEALEDQLARGDLDTARVQLTHLVGRTTTTLDHEEIARAGVESLAENTSDAVVAPLLWGGLGGIAGLAGYRAANTLDAMVGHRSARYEQFGWASARLDDVLNLAPARLTAILASAGAATVGGRASDALRAWRRDARHHPSPNAGPVEAAFAGALGVTLGGVNTYGTHTEDRHLLGTGPRPRTRDLHRARVLADRVGVLALLVSAAVAARPSRRRPSRR